MVDECHCTQAMAKQCVQGAEGGRGSCLVWCLEVQIEEEVGREHVLSQHVLQHLIQFHQASPLEAPSTSHNAMGWDSAGQWRHTGVTVSVHRAMQT